MSHDENTIFNKTTFNWEEKEIKYSNLSKTVFYNFWNETKYKKNGKQIKKVYIGIWKLQWKRGK